MLFDPGRIKQDVGPNLERGPTLRQGRTYRMTIDRQWPDSRGAELQVRFDEPLGAPDRETAPIRLPFEFP